MFGILHILSRSKDKVDLNELLDALAYSCDIESHFDYIRKCKLSKEECYRQFVTIIEPSSSKKNGEIRFKKRYEYSGDRRYLQSEFVYIDGWLLDMDYFLDVYVFYYKKSMTFYYQGAIDYHI